MSSIAIVIPAYKSTFLEETLQSLLNQTDKRFTVYIGDDCSPYDIKSIVDKYAGLLDISYKRFDENVGGKDLVAQWKRCISLCHEEWIWLFSDDDYMSPNCVELFRKELQKSDKYDIYHYNVAVVDRDNIIIKSEKYPNVIHAKELYKAKLLHRLDSYVVEYIFSRDIYDRKGGFIPFDLAWGSDTATWVKFAGDKGIKTIDNATISWRSSGENISTIQSEDIVIRKVSALIEFLKWGESQFPSFDIKIINDWGFAKRLFGFSTSVPNLEINMQIKKYTENLIRKFLIAVVLKIGGLYKIIK